jgi:mannitol/fructose-specific phosphotransferase system IIA component
MGIVKASKASKADGMSGQEHLNEMIERERMASEEKW